MFTRRIVIAATVTSLMLGFALPRQTAADDGPDKRTSTVANAATSNGGSDAAKEPKSVIETEIQELKDAVAAQETKLREQQEKIVYLESQLHGAANGPEGSASAACPPSEGSAIAVSASQPSVSSVIVSQQTGPQNPEDLSKRVQNIQERMKTFGPFVMSGDFRLRDEPWFGGPADQSLDRNRERYRLRFNVDTRLNSDFSAGFALATGDVNDPITTNQTATQFYARKPFNLDRAFIQYTPHAFKELTLVGGKFAYPWYNTELTWDKDLNPEGLAQTLAFDLDSTPVLKRIAFVGFELPFAEVAGVSLNNKSIVQSVTYGGQIQTVWQLARWLKFGAYSGFYDFRNADPIALALAKASAKNPQTPLVGLLPLGSGGNTVENSTVTTRAESQVTVAGTPYPTGVTTVTNAQFASKFGLFDSLARLDIATPAERWPLAFIGDYVQNTKTCENVPNILPAPANTATAKYSQSTNFPCDPNQRRGYWGEVQFGRALKRGDWQFGYTRIFIEREAVLSNFDYSEMRQGSNVEEHRVNALYQLHQNVQLAFTGLFGRPLNFGSSKPPEDVLKRLQFDVLYTF